MRVLPLSTVISNEAIDFQFSSTFAKELSTVMQAGIDECNLLKSNKNDESFVVTGMLKYCSRTMGPALRKVVEKHTNIYLDKVMCDLWMGKKPTPKGYFALAISLGDARSVLSKMSVANGYRDRSPGVANYRDVAEFETVATTFSGNNKLKENVFGRSKQRISASLYFDPVFAFCLDFFSPGDAYSTPTADELAALLLHEIGHLHTIIEHAGDAYCQYDRISSAILTMQGNDVDELMVLAPTTTSKAVKMTKAGIIDKELGDGVVSMVQGMTELCATRNDYLEAGTKAKFEDTMQALFRSAWVISLTFLYRVGFIYTIKQTLADMNNQRHMVDITSATKHGDSLATLHNLHRIERIADEYVSRNGMSAPLASVLTKLVDFKETTSIVGMADSEELRNNNTVANITKVTRAILSFLTIDKVSSKTYEDLDSRLNRMAQNTLKVFKDNNLPKSVTQEYIRDYEAASKIASERTPNQVLKIIRTISQSTNVPSVFFRMITTGNLSNDYKELLDTIDTLNANKLYYQSAKFQSMK